MKKRFLHLQLKKRKEHEKTPTNLLFSQFSLSVIVMQNFLGLTCPLSIPFHISFQHFSFVVQLYLYINKNKLVLLDSFSSRIKINSGIVSVLLFLYRCRQQHILLFRFSGYDLICKHFSDFLFTYMLENYKEDWSQFLKGVFTTD